VRFVKNQNLFHLKANLGQVPLKNIGVACRGFCIFKLKLDSLPALEQIIVRGGFAQEVLNNSPITRSLENFSKVVSLSSRIQIRKGLGLHSLGKKPIF
jgi:hypothetical protein